MSRLTRPLVATAVALAAGAGPALAAGTTAPAGAVRAHTQLTAKITVETPLIHFFYSLRGRTFIVAPGNAANAYAVLGAVHVISRIHADPAQTPGKLEWLLGAQEQVRGANLASYGVKESYRHDRRGRMGADASALAHLRLANYFLGDADSTLGVRHPEYATAPYPGRKTNPIHSPTPLLPKAPTSTLAGEIAFASPVIAERVLEHVPTTSFSLNQSAATYYLTLVGTRRVDPAQRPAQTEWIEGVRDLLTGDGQIIRGSRSISGDPIPTRAKREIADGFSTLRQANSLIARAQARLGIHRTSATVTLPRTVLYTS